MGSAASLSISQVRGRRVVQLVGSAQMRDYVVRRRHAAAADTAADAERLAPLTSASVALGGGGQLDYAGTVYYENFDARGHDIVVVSHREAQVVSPASLNRSLQHQAAAWSESRWLETTRRTARQLLRRSDGVEARTSPTSSRSQQRATLGGSRSTRRSSSESTPRNTFHVADPSPCERRSPRWERWRLPILSAQASITAPLRLKLDPCLALAGRPV